MIFPILFLLSFLMSEPFTSLKMDGDPDSPCRFLLFPSESEFQFSVWTPTVDTHLFFRGLHDCPVPTRYPSVGDRTACSNDPWGPGVLRSVRRYPFSRVSLVLVSRVGDDMEH